MEIDECEECNKKNSVLPVIKNLFFQNWIENMQQNNTHASKKQGEEECVCVVVETRRQCVCVGFVYLLETSGTCRR